MAKTVIFLFHDDNSSLEAGSHVAERIRQVAEGQGVELEVFCFGPAQAALTEESDDPVRAGYRHQIEALTRDGVEVHACLNAANAVGTAEALISRGVTLEYARDAFVRYALEGAAVISF
ncbi:DsrE family protein [Nesterenkonia sp. LB17]|uniref:DsrE family protein n=1 Tax=Nesterenkonia sp. LB17 TaxID=2901230 RepID=UPI001F4CAA32|nr:DsrE family protein [Nesterenkonia sp. LB17]MCH8564343.1 DsrE family protein [Nesterenkonia sp. LB17]